jgi:clan AA aspartic protease (TIGR02281 family)
MRLHSMSKFRFNNKAPVIILTILLEGQGSSKQKIRVALDTGATYTIIPWETAEVLGLEPELSKERIEIITASGVERAPLITLKSIVVLGKRIERVEAVVHDLPPKSYVDGLLGVKSLVELKLKIDFGKGILEV